MRRTRSRFVTGLGWFALVLGVISTVKRCSEFFAAASVSEPLPTLAGATHPIELFFFQHHTLLATLNLAAATLLALVGVGLVQRRPWAIATGSAFLLLGALMAGSQLFLVLSGEASVLARFAAKAPSLRAVLIVVYGGSLVWTLFLIWYFRRAHIRAEFLASRKAT